MPNKTILDYLKQNNISDTTKFSLQDDGEGVFINDWDYLIEKPSLPSPEAIELRSARDQKKAALKKLREENTAKLTPKDSSYSISVGGVNATFILKSSELPMLNSIISYLTRNSKQTRPWTDAAGIRRNLSLANFQSLHDHLLVRDEIEYSLYVKRLAKLETLTSSSAIESFDINEIFEV